MKEKQLQGEDLQARIADQFFKDSAKSKNPCAKKRARREKLYCK